jgi:hypothetical protein
MAPSQDTSSGTTRTRQTFMLYATGGRIYASNVKQKLIDLGSIAGEADGFAYQLDGEGPGGGGFASAEEALRDLAGKLRFLYLDGQFTAVRDMRDQPGLRLDQAAQLELTLDELGRDEPAINVNV